MKSPVLQKIRVNSKASEETPFFTAELLIDGRKFIVSNDGRGGANDYQPFLSAEMESELNKWADATLPAEEYYGQIMKPNFETWTFQQAFALCES